eukprot:scaffold32448_cov15-Tisochrysis_lutea.AAC.1
MDRLPITCQSISGLKTQPPPSSFSKNGQAHLTLSSSIWPSPTSLASGEAAAAKGAEGVPEVVQSVKKDGHAT